MMEKLNKHFLFEIRELFDNHILADERNRLSTKLEVKRNLVNFEHKFAETSIPKPVVVTNSSARDKIQIGLTIPR